MYQGKFDKKNKQTAASLPVKKNTSAPGKGNRGFGLGGYIKSNNYSGIAKIKARYAAKKERIL